MCLARIQHSFSRQNESWLKQMKGQFCDKTSWGQVSHMSFLGKPAFLDFGKVPSSNCKTKFFKTDNI